MTKPAIDTKDHLNWLVSRFAECSEFLNTPVQDIPRNVFLEWAQGTETSVSKRDVSAHGGYTKIKQYAAGKLGSLTTAPEALGTRREVAHANNTLRAMERMLGDGTYVAVRLHEALARAVEANPPKITNVQKKHVEWKKPADREFMLHISDTHFGLDIDSTEVIGGRYDWTTAARRIGLLCHHVAEYADDNSALTIVINGDIVEGRIHNDDRGVDLLAAQIDGARQIITSMIDYMRLHFQRITVVSQTGNHDRWPFRGEGRPSAQKYDSVTTTIMRGVEQIFRTAQDVTFFAPRTNYSLWTVRQWKFLATHGDDFFEISNPSKSIKLDALSAKIYHMESNNILDGHVDAVLMGHWHFPLVCRIPGRTNNQAWLTVNGCASGQSAYTRHIGVASVSPIQTFWEVTERCPIYNFRMVDLNDADDDQSWERIVAVPTTLGYAMPKIQATSDFHVLADRVQNLTARKRR